MLSKRELLESLIDRRVNITTDGTEITKPESNDYYSIIRKVGSEMYETEDYDEETPMTVFYYAIDKIERIEKIE
jgi:hypothetical protein